MELKLRPRYDVLVLGGGAGGLCAAARFAAAGRSVLLVEADTRLGGRWSTIDVDGYLVSTGAVAIEIGGVLEKTFRLVGAEFELRTPDPPVMVRIRGRNVRPGGPMWSLIVGSVTKNVTELIAHLRGGQAEPDLSVSLEAWVSRYTRSRTVHSVFQSLAASLFTVNANELPAVAFLRLLSVTGGYKRFGFAPHGNRALVDALAAGVRRHGGQIELGARAEEILTLHGHACGARIQFGKARRNVVANIVISNTGPRDTARMLAASPFAAEFGRRVAHVEASSMIALTLSSDEELIPVPGVWTLTGTARLYGCANLTASCPELAPPGKHLFDAWSIPKPAVGSDFNPDEEVDLLYRDLEAIIPGVRSRSRLVHRKIMRGEWPADRCRPGHEPSPITPLTGLYEVGDGVKPIGWTGTTACAETARIVFDYALSAGLTESRPPVRSHG